MLRNRVNSALPDDGQAYYAVYKLDRALNDEEIGRLLDGDRISALPGMHLPQSVKVSEYPAYVTKHQTRGDILQEVH